ncbi:MAG: alpha/beta hydrolase [Rickettsiales bacterium]
MNRKRFFFDVPIAGGEGTHKIAIYKRGGGSDANGTIFCAHGLTRNGRDFDVLASALSTNYQVYSIDIAGRGKSQWHADTAHYNYGDYVADVGYIINKLGISNIHWIGTSMGGIIGMMLANSFPKLLRTLTLNDIGCLIPAAGLARISEYVSALTNFKTRALAEAELRCRCAPYGIKDEEHWQNIFTHGIKQTEIDHQLTYDPEIAKNLFPKDKPIEDVNLWPLWEAIKAVPTMLIHGMDSDILTHQTAIQMEQSHPDFSLLEIENVGHAPALMDSVQIAAIKRWIDSH